MAEDSANTTGRINVTEEEVTCKLCSKFYSSPKLVECLHSFCQSCIQQNLVKEDDQHVFVCPKCLHVTKTGDYSLASLTSDLHVPRLLEVFKCHVTTVTPCTICTLEGNVGEATYRCLTCNDHLCTSCSKKHTFSSLTATHRVVSLVDLRSGKYDQDIMRKQTLLCKEHDQKECEFFCNTCSGPQCTKCILTKHRDHSYVDIKDAAAKKKSELFTLLQEYEDLSLPAGIQVAAAQADLDLLKQEENMFVKTVNEQTELIIETIKQQSRDCLQKAAKMFKEEESRRQVKKDIAAKRSEKGQNILRLCRTLLNNGGSEIVEMVDALNLGLTVISNEVPLQSPEMTTYKAQLSFPFDKMYFEVVKVDLPGSLSPKETPKEDVTGVSDEPKAKQNPVKQNVASAKLTPITQEDKKETFKSKSVQPIVTPHHVGMKKQHLQLNLTFSSEIQSDLYDAGISAMALKSNRQCYILDNMNARLKEFKLNGTKTRFVNLSGQCKPFDKFISIQSKTGSLIITVLSNVLNFFIINGFNFLKLHGTKIPSKDMKEEPLIANFANDIIVGNLPENELKLYNTSGKLLRTWKSLMQSPFEFLNYAGGDRLISSNWKGNGSVTIESEKNGLQVNILGRKRFGLPWRPADGVVDKEGHIIVSDEKRNEISVFSPNGSHLFFYDTSADAVLQPNCLFLDKNGRIYVSYKDGMVAVYLK